MNPRKWFYRTYKRPLFPSTAQSLVGLRRRDAEEILQKKGFHKDAAEEIVAMVLYSEAQRVSPEILAYAGRLAC